MLFALYTLLFCIVLHFLSSKNYILLESKYAILGFLLKLVCGCIYGSLFQQSYNGDDTWLYFRLSVEETALLKQDPLLFLKNCFSWKHYTTTYVMTNQWESVPYGFFIKLLAFFNILSGSSYYVNVVLFNMIIFWGAYVFYRFFVTVFEQDQLVVWLVVFGFLPVVFWTSGLRKDGLIYVSTGLYLLSLHQLINRYTFHYVIGMVCSILLLILNRSFMVFALLPASLGWIISAKRSVSALWVQCICLLTLFFIALVLHIPFLEWLSNKNKAFHALTGGSRLPLPILESSLGGLLSCLPSALHNVFLAPLPFPYTRPLMFIAGMETVFFLTLSILAVLFARKQPPRGQEAAFWALCSLAFLNYLTIGLIVPFSGAIVRYRVIFEFILITSFLSIIDWPKIKKYILNLF